MWEEPVPDDPQQQGATPKLDAARAREKAAREEAARQAEARRRREARHAEALAPVEALAVAWDFGGSAAELEKLHFDEPDFAARAARRRDEVRRMADLKIRMIEKINAHKPAYTRMDLAIPPFLGKVVKADQSAITADRPNGDAEALAWGKLRAGTVKKLLGLVVDRDSGDDWLAAAVLAFAAGDVPFAEQLFKQASSHGVDIGPYLAPLAAAALAEATQVLVKADSALRKGQFAVAIKLYTEASAALGAVEQKYAAIPWFTAQKTAIDTVRANAEAGIAEAQAEQLYTEVAKFFQENQLFDVRPLVQKLRAEYANTRPVTDAARKPSFAVMEQAVQNLGKFVVVRLDGKRRTDDPTNLKIFQRIQAAIDAVPPDSMIEIQDDGPYDGTVVIPKEKEGLTLRGRKDCWPMITSSKPTNELVAVIGSEITLERLVVLVPPKPGHESVCVAMRGNKCKLRLVITYCQGRAVAAATDNVKREVEDCLIIGGVHAVPSNLENCLLLGEVGPYLLSEFRSCTILKIGNSAVFLADSIIGSIHNPNHRKYRIEHCDVFWKPAPTFGKNCFSANPQFVNPNAFNFRLAPTSPCIGKASDGGDLGVRYTPKMVEMCQKAWQLKQQGIIQFEFKP